MNFANYLKNVTPERRLAGCQQWGPFTYWRIHYEDGSHTRQLVLRLWSSASLQISLRLNNPTSR